MVCINEIFVSIFLIYSALYQIILASEFRCTSPIFCNGPLLHAIQTARLFNESKTFVDMPLMDTPENILKAFDGLPQNYTREDLLNFVNKYFAESGSDMYLIEPKDWKDNPVFINKFKDMKLKEWVDYLHSKWKLLLRVFNHTECGAECHSSLWVPNPFIVPGGRFREYYYWDSYFIVEGLILSEMYETVKGIIENYFYLLEKHNIIPNGGRVYYLNRSQPPLLTLMVQRYYESTKDIEFLKKSIPYLEKEYNFWMKNRKANVDDCYKAYLNQYNVNASEPRPESYMDDVLTSMKFTTNDEKSRLFKNLASGAESGWDFSSRWFENTNDITSIKTSEIIPVDLNSIMFQVEMILSQFHNTLGNSLKKHIYFKKAKLRQKLMHNYLYNKDQCLWNDYHLDTKLKNSNIYMSNVLPLWAGITTFAEDGHIDCLMNSLLPFIDFDGGLPISLILSGQQWDFPDGWAPMQFFFVKALENLNNTKADLLARQITEKWIYNNYCTWKKTGYMFEKYNIKEVGNPGRGGEYVVQEGFGWTNGVALYFLEKYGTDLKLPECPK